MGFRWTVPTTAVEQVECGKMELLTGTAIRDFKVRGNYRNQHTLLARTDLCPPHEGEIVARYPGYSPPVVQFHLDDGARGTVVVSDVDVPLLCQDDFEGAKSHLSLILNARAGDAQAGRELAATVEEGVSAGGSVECKPAETRYIVPCTSSEQHSAQEISDKGSTLLKLTQQGYPVPDFVVLASQNYADYGLEIGDRFAEAIEQLQIITRQKLGCCQEPLVFAIRCATPHYVPGLMDTYLNVGITESTFPRVEKLYGPVAAAKMYLNNLRNVCNALELEDCAAIASKVRFDLPADEVSRLIDRLSETIRRTDRRLVEDALYQATFLAKRAYRRFEDKYDLMATLCRGGWHYPSLILQKMVCSVRHEHAYAGVISSRHTQTGIGMELQTAHNIFGEEMMTGTAEIQSTVFDEAEQIRERFPAVYHFVPNLPELEREFQSPVTIEFVVEATKRYEWFALLQLNETGMAGRAAITAVIDLHKSGAISRRRVTELIRPYHIKQLSSDTIDQEEFSLLNSFASGVAVLPRSAVSARVYFSSEAALKAKSVGEKVCLCKSTFVPTDTVVMREMDAILSLTSAAIHVVTICQSLGIPALLSLEKNGVSLHPEKLVNSSGGEIKEGEWITISSRRRAIYQGEAKYKPARLLLYMRGEDVQFEGEQEKKAFDNIVYAYRYYQQLIRGLTVNQISDLNEIIRLVNFELRSDSEEAKQLVNGWFDERETRYVEEVLKSDIGDHLAQSRVFEMLTMERRVRFFKGALEKCCRERISGYEAGAFMLGRFLSVRYPVVFWKCFTPQHTGMLVNEWVLFEKYMQLLHNMGERKVLQARKKILKEGLDDLQLHPGKLQALITLKLAGRNLDEVRKALADWSDRQAVRVLELLQQPYRVFYDFRAKWSVGELEKICREENLPMPQPEDV